MSSFLKLKLTIAKKPWWKSLTSKIQRKLRNKKPKSTANKPVVPKTAYKFFLKTRLRSKKRRFLLLKGRDRGPVYVDKLLVVGPAERSTEKREAVVDHDHDRWVDRTAVEAAGAGDDIWESMGFASPLMHGIDARAEEFIAKFRADMEVQEKLARHGL